MLIIKQLLVGQPIFWPKKSQQIHYYYRIAKKIAEVYQYLLLKFQ